MRGWLSSTCLPTRSTPDDGFRQPPMRTTSAVYRPEPTAPRLGMKTRSLLLLMVSSCALPALAADWPQWRGPDRTDISKETGLLRSWPKNGPALVWTCKEAGTGYSGPAI